MISYFVRYDGTSADPGRFYGHYRGPHADILKGFDGISGLVLHRPAAWNDPFPVNAGNTFLLAQMEFPGEAELAAGLASEARVRARDDFASFPAVDGAVTHQAMIAERLF